MKDKYKKQVKDVLKRNELAVILDKVFHVFGSNRLVRFLVIAVVVLILGGLAGRKFYHVYEVKTFNQKFLEAQQGLKKEENLKQVIADFSGLPAHHLARFELANYYIESQKSDLALQVLTDGLQEKRDADILSTLLVIKTIEIYKSQGEFAKAAQFVADHLSDVLSAYQPELRLQQADFYASAGDVEKARLIYTELSSQNFSALPTDPTDGLRLVRDAKEKLLALELK